MFGATHNFNSGELIVHINNQIMKGVNNENLSGQNNQNHYKILVPNDFIINSNTNSSDFICLVTAHSSSSWSDHLIYSFIHTRHASNTDTHIRIRQTTKDKRGGYTGSNENHRGDVDIVFFSNVSFNLFNRFKINDDGLPLIITGSSILDHTESKHIDTDINKYNIFLTIFLGYNSDTLDNTTNDNLTLKIAPNTDSSKSNQYYIQGWGKDGNNNEHGGINMSGKDFFYAAIRKDIGTYYNKDNYPIIITGSSRNREGASYDYNNNNPNAIVTFTTTPLPNTNYSILLTPDDKQIGDMVSLQIVAKETTFFEIKGYVKTHGDSKGGGNYDFNTRYFQWAIIR